MAIRPGNQAGEIPGGVEAIITQPRLASGLLSALEHSALTPWAAPCWLTCQITSHLYSSPDVAEALSWHWELLVHPEGSGDCTLFYSWGS